MLGHNETLLSADAVAWASGTGADVLARLDLGAGPSWLLHRAGGNRPRPVDPPAELTRRPRLEPLLFRGPRDSSDLIERAAWSAPDLPDTQIVGVHVTGDGYAVLGDGSVLQPEDFAMRVQRDRRFVLGPTIALLGCAAYRRRDPGALSFAERFIRALGGWAWAADTEVLQTADGRVHATETAVTQDGRLLPMFPYGQGTGHWSLLDPDGQQVDTRGPELWAALTGMTPPRYTDHTPEPLIVWSDNDNADLASLDDRDHDLASLSDGDYTEPEPEEEAYEIARRAYVAGEPFTPEELGALFVLDGDWGEQQLDDMTEELELQQEARRVAREAEEAGDPLDLDDFSTMFGRNRGWVEARIAEMTEAREGELALEWAVRQPVSTTPLRNWRNRGSLQCGRSGRSGSSGSSGR